MMNLLYHIACSIILFPVIWLADMGFYQGNVANSVAFSSFVENNQDYVFKKRGRVVLISLSSLTLPIFILYDNSIVIFDIIILFFPFSLIVYTFIDVMNSNR